MSENQTENGPLAGVRVIDLSRLVAGNQLTMLLGDFGAEVIKVERPGSGDLLRHWRADGKEVHWKVYGRNKKSTTVDLKHPGGRDLLRRLLTTAHVMVESFRPGTLEELDLSPEGLLAENPRLVLVRISGWGQTGSFAHKPGFGTLVEAMSGLAAMNGFPDRQPVLPPGAIADMVAGTYGAFAVSSALRHAESTGEGQIVDLSLFEPLFSVLGPTAAMYQLTGRVPERSGSRSHSTAPRNVYGTADQSWLALSGSTQTMTERLFRSIGRPELITDPRFVDNAARLRNVADLDAILEDHFASRSLEQNLKDMDEAGVTVAPVADISYLMETEFFHSRGVVIDGPDADGEGPVPMHAVTPRLTGTPGSVRMPAPLLGEHNGEVLRPLVAPEAWEDLCRDGVVQA